MMVKVLEEADQDLILAEIHNKGNRLTVSHLRALGLIERYKSDPIRVSAIGTIIDIRRVLVEAIQ